MGWSNTQDVVMFRGVDKMGEALLEMKPSALSKKTGINMTTIPYMKSRQSFSQCCIFLKELDME